MPIFNFSSLPLMDGIASLKVSQAIDATHATPKCYSLGELFDGKISIKESAKQENSYGITRVKTYELEITAKLMYTSITKCLKVQDYMTTSKLDVVATLRNGLTITTALLYNVTGTTNTIGYTPKFDSSKDFNGMRYLDVTMKRIVSETDLALLTADNTAVLAYATADAVLALLETQTKSDVWQAGAFALGIAPTGGSVEPINDFNNLKLQLNGVEGKTNQIGIPLVTAFSLHIEAEKLAAAAADIAAMKLMNNQAVDVAVTLPDGTFKSVSQQGVYGNFNAESDSKGTTTIKITADGIIPNTASSQWDALWTANA